MTSGHFTHEQEQDSEEITEAPQSHEGAPALCDEHHKGNSQSRTNFGHQTPGEQTGDSKVVDPGLGIRLFYLWFSVG